MTYLRKGITTSIERTEQRRGAVTIASTGLRDGEVSGQQAAKLRLHDHRVLPLRINYKRSAWFKGDGDLSPAVVGELE